MAVLLDDMYGKIPYISICGRNPDFLPALHNGTGNA
jgi:hypothetical protein